MKHYLINTLPFAVEGQAVLREEPDEIASDAICLTLGKPLPVVTQVTFALASDRGTRLCGLVANTLGMLIVRREVAAIFADLENQRVQVIPARLVCEKRGVRADDYAVVNPLDPVPCLDVSLSKCKRSGTRVTSLAADGVVLDRTRLPDRALFRISERPMLYFARSDALARIKALPLEELNMFLHDVAVHPAEQAPSSRGS